MQVPRRPQRRSFLVDARPVCTGSAQAGLIFDVSVNTSPLTGQTGFLDFQFNPGDSRAAAAMATVTDFLSVGGVLAPSSILTGDAAGSLPARYRWIMARSSTTCSRASRTEARKLYADPFRSGHQ